MDSRALWFSAAFLAARLALALWFALIAWSILDRKRASLGWQASLATATLGCSWWGVFALDHPTWIRPLWLVQSGLAAIVILNCLRRWVARPQAGTNGLDSEFAGHGWAHWLLACSGTIISSLAMMAVSLPQFAVGGFSAASLSWQSLLAGIHLLSCAALLGIALATAIELTCGVLEADLLALGWRRLSRLTSIAWIVQLGLACCLLRFGVQGSAAAESLMPTVFALAVIAIGYIVWMIPWRMSSFAKQQKVIGQVSLAMAAWLAVLCLGIASGLPSSWPWSELRLGSGSGPTFSSMEQ